MIRRLSLLLVSLCLNVTGYAILPFENYLKQFRRIMQDCSMDYEMTIRYPDSTSLSVHGRMAVKKEQYFDSSNVRFVLKNDTWYIVASHQDKNIAIAYLPGLNEQFKGIGSLSGASWLFSHKFFMENFSFRLLKEDQFSVWIDLSLKNNPTIESLVIQLSKRDFSPLSYHAVINYPVNGMEEDYRDGAVMRIDISCWGVSFPASPALFDDSRIVRRTARRAILKRYSEYKTVLSNH